MANQDGFDFGVGSGFVDGGGGIDRPTINGFEFGGFAAGFDEGFDAGYDEGYDDGLVDGFADGFAAGAASGPPLPEPPSPVPSPFTTGDPEFVDLVADALDRMTMQFRSGDE